MKKDIYFLKKTTLLLLLFLWISKTGFGQTVNLPNCTNCPTSTSSSSIGSCGTFPHEIVDFDANHLGDAAFVTTNGKVFWLGTNRNNTTEFQDQYSMITAPTNFIDTPLRMDIPAAGVKAIDVSVAAGAVIVLGDDGNLYAWGYPTRAIPNLTNIAPGLNQQTLVPVTLPAGLTATKMVALDSRNVDHGQSNPVGAIVIIASDGNTYYFGHDMNAGTNHVSSWTQVTNPTGGVTYTNLWGFSQTGLDSGAYVYFEGSDGKYYSFGNSGWGYAWFAWGNSSFTPSYDYYNYVGIGVPFSGQPIQMGFPAGVVIDHIEVNDGITGFTPDGKAYSWGDGTDPTELTLPGPGPTYNTPTKFISVHPLSTQSGLWLTDAGLFYKYDPTLGDPRTPTFYSAYPFSIETSGNFLHIPLFCNEELSERKQDFVLSASGRLYRIDEYCGSSHSWERLTPVLDGRYDPRNPRPTE